MAGYDAEIRIGTKVDSSQMQRLQIQIDKTANKVAMLSTKYEELKNKKIPTDDFLAVQKQIDETQTRLNSLLAKKDTFQGKRKSATWLNMNAEIDELEKSLPYLQGEMQDLVDTGKAFTLGRDTEEFRNAAKDITLAESELRALLTKQGELGVKQSKVSEGLKRIGDASKKTFGGIHKDVKKTSGLFSTFATRLKGIVLSLLIFNWITKAFNSMVTGIKEGFKNLVKYSDDYNKSISMLKSANTQLKNSFAAAFAPIIQMVIPHLITLIKYLTAAANKVAQFVAVLSGKTTWTKAKGVQADYAASLDKTAASAKKAAGALASFDTLEVLSKKDSGGSGSESSEVSPKDMFEEVPIDNNVLKLKDTFALLIGEAKKLKGIFQDGFFDGLGDFEPRLQSIKDSLLLIRDSLVNIFTDPAVADAAGRYVESVVYNLARIIGATASIGITLAQNLIGGLGKYLSQNTNRVKKHLISIFDIGTEVWDMAGNFAEAFAYVFEAFGSENGQQLTANLIGVFTDSFMGLNELLAKLSRELLNIITLPFIENKETLRAVVEDSLGVISDILGTLKTTIDNTFDKVNEVYDEHFKPFFDSIAKGFSGMLATFLDAYNKYFLPVIQKISEKFSVLMATLQPHIDNFLGMIGSLMDLLTLLWVNILQPLLSWLIENVVAFISGMVSAFADVLFPTIEFFGELFGTVIETVKGALDGLIEFFTGVFTGNWEQAWEGIKKIVSSVWDGIWNVIKTIVNAIIGLINKMISAVIGGINSVIDAINSIKIDIPEWVPAFGGSSFNLGIPRIAAPQIPYLANGAVLRGGNPFMAVLGDQPAGQTNIEAPASLIRQMVAEGMSQGGNRGGGDFTLNMNYDGETFARVFIKDFLSEMNRQGYDVDILGGLT